MPPTPPAWPGFNNRRVFATPVYSLVRPFLFRMDPERAHDFAMRRLARLQAAHNRAARMERRNRPDPRLTLHFAGSAFRGPLGVAAGFDKGALAPDALLALGFSHVEVGTVTPEPQEGNPKPRLERVVEEKALVNRMGFNNPGMAVVAERLQARRHSLGVVGANVGANKATVGSAEKKRITEDYVKAATMLAPYVSYVTINVSSPNTPGLRALQTPKGLAGLVDTVCETLDDEKVGRPVLVKLHPDAPLDELVQVAKAAVDAGAGGLVTVNTTAIKPPEMMHVGEGGISGKPLQQKAQLTLATLYRSVGDQVPLIGVGGIMSGYDAAERIAAGATLLQSYTGFIYGGPRFPVEVHEELVAELDKRGLDRLEELVGAH